MDVGVSGGVWGRERGYCMMVGGDDEAVGRLVPVFEALAPGVGAAARTPGREGDPPPEEQGWLHCGPSGAGHFVKMVHNGIEYGLMQAYAEGLNVLKHANIGLHAQETDAETTPLRDPDHYKYELDVAAITELWRRGSVVSSWLLDLTAQALDDVAEPRRVRGPCERLRRGPVDGAGCSRGGRAGAGAGRVAVRPLRVARRGRLGQPRPLRHAPRVRRPPREEPGAVTDTENPLAEGLLLKRVPDPCALVIFGASGDLTHKKLMPALYALAFRHLLPPRFAIVGVARTEGDDDSWRAEMQEAVQQHGRDEFRQDVWDELAATHALRRDGLRRRGRRGRARGARRAVRQGETSSAATASTTSPSRRPRSRRSSGRSASGAARTGWTRLIVEKPFGHDLASARELNKLLWEHFDESEIFRIDHYLGKETVQNMLALRFANGVFEPIWNRQFIDHVQITVAESIGIEGRAGYYEAAGAMRDIFQNHLLQLLALTAMEPPIDFAADSVHRREGEGAEGAAHARARSRSCAASTAAASSRARRCRRTARSRASPPAR